MTSKDEPSEEEHGHVSARRDAAHATRKKHAATTSTASVVAIVNLTSTSVTGLDWAALTLSRR